MAEKVLLRGNGTQVFAMTQGLAMITYDVAKQSKLSVVEDGRNIIKAGTPIPSNDAKCIGLCFEDWDVTESGGPISVAIGGYVNEYYMPVVVATAAKNVLKNIVFLNNAQIAAGAEVKIAVTSGGKASAFTPATGVKLTVTLTGDEYNERAAHAENWILTLPKGYYVASAEKTGNTTVVLTVKAFPDADPANKDMKVRVAVISAALVKESVPTEVNVNLFQAEA